LQPHVEPEGATIAAIHLEQLDSEARYNAILLRLTMTYDRTVASGPQSVIAKLPTAKSELHERATVFQPGTRENWFYRSGAPASPVLVPSCYLNDVHHSTNESVLLLEDLAPAQPGSWLGGASPEQAALALESLARLHARWWGQADCDEIRELNQLIAASFDKEQNLVQELYYSAWPEFLRQQADAIPADVRQFGDAIIGNMKRVDDLSKMGPATLVHGDYRLDNILFGRRDGKLVCWVIDWEDVYFGNAMIDLTWFIGGCLLVEDSQDEIDPLRHYHQVLIDEGVRDYNWAACFDDYRRSMCTSFVQGVLSATLDQGASEYDQKLSRVIAQRFVSAAQRLNLLAFMYT
jgi:thiamine kinase-like enzyme